ncbi:hypothetical protein IW146_010587 [Coemansia sp. RSA 922]|nr:hypothetical protein H4S03_006322 [Coemansia sp. S3946]KAJ2048404.1 hypothetical protein H4S04_003849 [Coemansia sp. S16]KAJ2068498.1 hypothetical protein GGH13_004885 [Coemansia sp. S155-1]KAJ2095077.1 hypothetical protein IW146_010587 [Coemansia sp. RSA 922]KAJ2334409.1 hypothetical protein GGH92_008331 [Coemansia sp. RSA 2673]
MVSISRFGHDLLRQSLRHVRCRAHAAGRSPMTTAASTSPHSADQELALVDKWKSAVIGQKTVLWDRMDARPLTLLDQTVRPYLPPTYPSLTRSTRVGDIVGGTAMPPAAHLVYFPSPTAEPDLAPDGYHADEAPPEPFSQRVWAGGLIEFNPLNPLRVDAISSQTKSIVSVTVKDTPTLQRLVFVKLALEMSNSSGHCLTEYRDLAYMKPVDLGRKIVPHVRSPDFTHVVDPSEILLFRYSALSWNSHRIHYDSPYARHVEGHPGLLVHGPLTCTLLLQLLHANTPPGLALKSFEYRAISPAYCQQQMTLNGRWMLQRHKKPSADDASVLCELWATNNEGGIAMKGVATLVPSP